jgi:pyrimidine operon attenuation protein/uracil phosphoribosyltransferase
VDNVVREAASVDEPDILIIDKTLQLLDNYFPDRTLVAFLNKLLKVGRAKRLNWLVDMLRRFARSNGIPMTQTWKTGLQIRKPSGPLPE